MKKNIAALFIIASIIGCVSYTYKRQTHKANFIFDKKNATVVYGFEVSLEKAFNNSDPYKKITSEKINKLFYKEGK